MDNFLGKDMQSRNLLQWQISIERWKIVRFLENWGVKNRIKALKVYEFKGKRMNLHVLTLQLPLSLLANEKYIK